MTVLNLNERRSSGGSSEDRPVLPTDTYRMKILEAKMEDDTYSKPNRDGSLPQKLALTWEVSWLTEEQQELADEVGEEWLGVRIWSRINPYYGDVKAGGPSKFKAFIDSLVAQGIIVNLDLDAFDIEDLIGIEQRCMVESYLKTMGPNVGQPGNKINAFAALRAPKKASGKVIAVAQDAPVLTPTPEAVEAAKPTRGRNVPQPLDSDDIPF